MLDETLLSALYTVSFSYDLIVVERDSNFPFWERDGSSSRVCIRVQYDPDRVVAPSKLVRILLLVVEYDKILSPTL